MNEPCFICDDTGLVCEKHPDRPVSGKFGRGCGAPSIPCLVCSDLAAKDQREIAEKLRHKLG